MTIELVILLPILFIVVALAIGAGRVESSRQLVVEAARAGADAASLQSSPATAQWAASALGVVGGYSDPHLCRSSSVSTDTSEFRPGGFVTVTVICQVVLSDSVLPGLPGSLTVTATATSPIDSYRSVG